MRSPSGDHAGRNALRTATVDPVPFAHIVRMPSPTWNASFPFAPGNAADADGIAAAITMATMKIDPISRSLVLACMIHTSLGYVARRPRLPITTLWGPRAALRDRTARDRGAG